MIVVFSSFSYFFKGVYLHKEREDEDFEDDGTSST